MCIYWIQTKVYCPTQLSNICHGLNVPSSDITLKNLKKKKYVHLQYVGPIAQSV